MRSEKSNESPKGLNGWKVVVKRGTKIASSRPSLQKDSLQKETEARGSKEHLMKGEAMSPPGFCSFKRRRDDDAEEERTNSKKKEKSTVT